MPCVTFFVPALLQIEDGERSCEGGRPATPVESSRDCGHTESEFFYHVSLVSCEFIALIYVVSIRRIIPPRALAAQLKTSFEPSSGELLRCQQTCEENNRVPTARSLPRIVRAAPPIVFHPSRPGRASRSVAVMQPDRSNHIVRAADAESTANCTQSIVPRSAPHSF